MRASSSIAENMRLLYIRQSTILHSLCSRRMCTHTRCTHQVSQGLVGLGWTPRDAEAACDEVEPLLAEQPDLGVAALMRAALQTLARR